MHIRLSTDGGFAYLPRQPINVDLDSLPADESAALQQLVENAGFFALPEKCAAQSGGDMREFTIEVDNGEQCHTVTVPETEASPALIELIDRLQAQPGG
jgi:hypothetical protein